MSFPADVPVLHGSLVRLEPLSVSHGADLAVAAEEDRGAYGFTCWRRLPRSARVTGGPSGSRPTGIPGSGRPAPSHLPGRARLISAGPGWPPRLSGRASIPRPSC